MKTSNKLLIVGVLAIMILMAIGMVIAKSELSASYIKPSGNIVTKTYDVANFDKINLRDKVQCTLVKADKQLVKVEIDEEWVEKLNVSVSGDEYLGFDLEGFGQTGPIKVTVNYTDLTKLTIKDATCTGNIATDSLEHLYVIAGSSLDATMDVKYCNLLMQSGSKANLKGSCASLNTQSESGSILEAEELMVDSCTASVQSGSQSKLNVSTTLSAIARSGGSISYLGNPEMGGLEVKSGGSVDKIEEGTSL